MADWLILLTIGLPWLGALCVWFRGDKHPRDQHALAVLFAVATAVISVILLFQAQIEAEVNVAMRVNFFGAFTLVPDGLGVFLAAIAAVIGSLCVIFSINYMDGEDSLGRYYGFVLLFIGAMIGLVLSGNLLFMFIFWEITALCSYALIAFHNDDPKAVAGGIKALIITSIGGVGLLAGALLIYSETGSYQIAAFMEAVEAGTFSADMLKIVAFGFLIAAAAKSAQFPFQTWLPDAMEAPTPISALIHAATMVNAGVYLLARFYPAFADVANWKDAVMICGLISALMAGVMALVATDLKRVLAYSTVSQLGYMVYAIGVGALFASQFHLLSHAVFKALLFLGAGAVIHTVGTRDMRQMGGLRVQMPRTALVFCIGALALVGLPPANGFFSKELLLEGGQAAGPQWAYIGMLIGAGLTALYTLRMVMMVFFGQPASQREHVHDAPKAMLVSLGVLAVGTLLIWILAGTFGNLLERHLSPTYEWVVEEESAAATGGVETTEPAAAPAEEIEGTDNIVEEIVSASATYIALGVIALGFAIWFIRRPLAPLATLLRPIARVAENSFGFEWINRRVVTVTQNTAEMLRVTQTGQLNWNVVGIVGALLVVSAILALGG